MKFFDTFGNTEYRMKMLNLFPAEFSKGYMLYK
nr:MAG TPA: portal protein [Caudoviricetes sp.]